MSQVIVVQEPTACQVVGFRAQSAAHRSRGVAHLDWVETIRNHFNVFVQQVLVTSVCHKSNLSRLQFDLSTVRRVFVLLQQKLHCVPKSPLFQITLSKIIRLFDFNDFYVLNPEKICHQYLVHLQTSPVYCSHFTSGNPKKLFFNNITHTYFRLFTLSQKKTNCYLYPPHLKMSPHYLVKCTILSSD